jgi:hypothetical protein
MADKPIEQADFDQYLKNPILYPEAFKDWISDWYATNVPKLHVSQIFGFKLQSMKVAENIATAESTTSASYVDLATVGPTIENISNGFYVVIWGCHCSNAAEGFIGVSVDGATPTGDLQMSVSGLAGAMAAVGRMAIVDLSTGDNNHTLKLMYLASSVQHRWLHALKVVTEDA